MVFPVENKLQLWHYKQAQEIIFSKKATKKIHHKIFFNNVPGSKADSQKRLGLHLDLKLFFDSHIKII